tara:strand:- start:283 stop:450 length:168 start_codon:yes stop_codon:yes gene_type:complete
MEHKKEFPKESVKVILSNQIIGLECQVRNAKGLAKSEIIRKKQQLIIKRTLLFKP